MSPSTLTQARIEALRKQYDADVLIRSAEASLATPWAPARDSVHAQLDLFFPLSTASHAPPIPPRLREGMVIGLLAHTMTLPVDLAIHVYWGLMEGLDPDEIYACLALSSLYGGLCRYADGGRITVGTFAVLADLPEDKLDTLSAVGAVAAAFATTR